MSARTLAQRQASLSASMTISTWADRTLWALDLETTSADPEQARIVQACVARILPARDDGTRLVDRQGHVAEVSR
jgi:hypothetical protein